MAERDPDQRKGDEDVESLQALQERVPVVRGMSDFDDADNPDSLEMGGQDLANIELDVVVLPPQADEFTCMECFLVKHRSQIHHDSAASGPVCTECAA